MAVFLCVFVYWLCVIEESVWNSPYVSDKSAIKGKAKDTDLGNAFRSSSPNFIFIIKFMKHIPYFPVWVKNLFSVVVTQYV